MGRSRSVLVLVLAGAAALGLTGCGGTPLAGDPAPAPSESPTAVASAAPAWPDPALTVVTTPRGVREPTGPVDVVAYPELTWLSEEEGITVEQAAVRMQDQERYGLFSEAARAAMGDRYSAIAFGDPDDPAELPWVAYTGEQPPPELVALAEQLPFPVELRGGAALSDAEREVAIGAGVEAFKAFLPEAVAWSGGLDAPTAVFGFSGFPPGLVVPDDVASAAVVAAAQESIGRDAPFTVELSPDDRDPLTTEPAVWLLPAGFVPDPAATSVEVLVSEDGCTSGQGAEGNTAEPEVEVTATEVRIAVSTYIRKGPQACPNHPLAPLLVDIGEPLGDRTLVDVHGTLDDDVAPWVNLYGDVTVPQAG